MYPSGKCVAERLSHQVSSKWYRSRDSTVGVDRGAKADDLSRGDVAPARVVGVVHIVVDSWE